MAAPKRILLRVNSNIERYQVCVDDGCGRFLEPITTRRACLCVCVRSPSVRVVLRGGNESRYFLLDASKRRVFDLFARFAETPAPTPPVNTFTLTDAIYGLPIDGILLFSSI